MLASLLKKRYKLISFSRRLILILIDNFLMALSLKLCFWFLYNQEINYFLFFNRNILFLNIITTIFYIVVGQYSAITKYLGLKILYKSCIRNLIVAITFSIFVKTNINYFSINTNFYKFLILFWILLTSSMVLFRITLKEILIKIYSIQNKINNNSKTNIAIYGAGEAGAQLAAALKFSNKYAIKTFLDDNRNLWGRSIEGIKINSHKILSDETYQINEVLLAIPSLSKSSYKKILDKINVYSKRVRKIPSVDELTTGNVEIDNLRDLEVTDLLGRDPIKTDLKMVGRKLRNKTICVTGAGGSIGSELCREIMKLSPKKLIIIDMCEVNLYKIDNELRNFKNGNSNLVTILGDLKNKTFVRNIFNNNQIEIIFHAAAYKHVPLVEDNPMTGLLNNILCTKIICEQAHKKEVDSFVLISTDKAVRPTNVMGASKRIAELIVNYYSKILQTNSEISNPMRKKTKYSIVRFGNVLGSSGSVVPLFQELIAKRQSIPITHPDIERFFMTITEAVQLVLQTSIYSLGGEVFILNMGDPVKIKDLAIKMIKLSGLTIKHDNFPKGDIEITYTGLRKGEKLYEELFLEEKVEITNHPLIYRALVDENYNNNFLDKIDNLIENLKNENQKISFALLQDLVKEWKPTKKIKEMFF